MESSSDEDDTLLSLRMLSSSSISSDSNGETSSAETSSILSDSDAIPSDALSGDEEEASASYKTLDSTEETSSSSVTTASEEASSAETSSIFSIPSAAYINYESSDQELFVSTFTRANFLATYIHQIFSLPDPIMEYIAKNPASPEVYQKLISTCKYFFLKNSILVAPTLKFVYKADGWYAKFNGKRILVDDVSSKFWVTGELSICNFYQDGHDQNILSSITQKIFRCDNKSIDINHQNISFNDLVLLASKCEWIRFYSSTVVENDGSVVPCEKVFAALPLVNHFFYENHDKEIIPQIFTSKTIEELIKLPHFATLKILFLNLPHNIDLVRFYEFFKEKNETRIQLFFCDPTDGSFVLRFNLHLIQENA